MYTQVSRGNVFTCTSVRAAILKNLKCEDVLKTNLKISPAYFQISLNLGIAHRRCPSFDLSTIIREDYANLKCNNVSDRNYLSPKPLESAFPIA